MFRTMYLTEDKRHIYNGRFLCEVMGSFPNQSQKAEVVSKEIFLYLKSLAFKHKKNAIIKFSKHDDLFGTIDYVINWNEKNVYGETLCSGKKESNEERDGYVITLNIVSEPSENPETVTSVAHELMHCYQSMLPAYRGVNKDSLEKYKQIQNIFETTNDELTYYFFHALYGLDPLEIGANISCVNNFVSEFIKERGINNVNGKRLRNILERCSNYEQYVDYFRIFSDKDRFYENSVTNILKLWSQIEGEEKTYDDFIEKTNYIVKTSEDILKKMDKNAMLGV